LLRVASATALAVAGLALPAATATAQDPPPAPLPLHNVKYSVWAEVPTPIKVYYRDVDPPNWADYSHNPYVFSPKAEAHVGPDEQWNLDVQLINPNQWAMVVATSGPGAPTNVHCVLAVDGVVVQTNQGPRGALCSIRNW